MAARDENLDLMVDSSDVVIALPSPRAALIYRPCLLRLWSRAIGWRL
jgi:hypothetical protein